MCTSVLWFLGCLPQRCRRVVCWKKNSAVARLGGMNLYWNRLQVAQHLSRVWPHIWCSQIYGKVMPSALPSALSELLPPSILGILPKATRLSLVCGPFLKSIFHNRLLLLIGDFGGLKVHLSNGKEEKGGSASHPLWNNSYVCYLTLLLSAKADRMVSLYLGDNVYVESALNLWCWLLPVAYLWCPPQGWSGLLVMGTLTLSHSQSNGEHLVLSHPIVPLFTIVLETSMCKKHTDTTIFTPVTTFLSNVVVASLFSAAGFSRQMSLSEIRYLMERWQRVRRRQIHPQTKRQT